MIRLKKVDLPAPFGPITAAISALDREIHPVDGGEPVEDFATRSTSSIAIAHLGLIRGSATKRARMRSTTSFKVPAIPPGNANSKTISTVPIMNGQYCVGSDLLVEHDEGGGADGRTPEHAHAAEDRHDSGSADLVQSRNPGTRRD